MNASERKALFAYRLAHWGLGGDGTIERSSCADPRAAGVLAELGQLVSVVYRTRKAGDDELTDYEHKFQRGHLPILAFTHFGPRSLVIAGGAYTMSVRGIVR